MSVRRLGRSYGCAVTCNRCGNRITTGDVIPRVNREYAATQGWGRGRVKGDKQLGYERTTSHDFCPVCLPLDHATAELQLKERATLRAARDAKRKALWATASAPAVTP